MPSFTVSQPSNLAPMPFSPVSPQTAMTTAAGPDVSAQSTVPLSSPLQIVPAVGPFAFRPSPEISNAPWCGVFVDALPTPTVVPVSTAPWLTTTMKFIMTTECSTMEPQSSILASLKGSTIGQKGSLVVIGKSSDATKTGTSTTVLTTTSVPKTTFETRTTLVTAVVTSTSVLSTISPPITTPSATAPPAPFKLSGKPRLSPRQIGLISTASVLGLLLLMALIFFLVRYLRKRKELHHDQTSRFWRGMFAPSRPADRAIPLSEVPGTGGPAPLQPTFPNPYITPDPGTLPGREPMDSFEAAAASKANLASSHKFPKFFNSHAEREAARARAQGGNTDAFSGEPGECGLVGGKGPNHAFVEVCLDEDVALEEQEKAERRRMEEMAGWDTPRRSMSPFPTNPFAPKAPPPEGGE